jgi:uncharacterized 2Fe-2S/4Fe-4S cluster protein (DUF4445 family)
VQVLDGAVRRRSTLRLSQADVAAGWALACQAVVEGDCAIHVPEQETIERRLTSDLTVAEVQPPADYDPRLHQSVRRVHLTLSEPSMDDQTDDRARLLTGLRQQHGIENVRTPLPALRQLSAALRSEAAQSLEGVWLATVVLDKEPDGWRLIDVQPGHLNGPLWGVAIDIGTTTVTAWLVDLLTGKVWAQASEYNGQISRGEDVISRIVWSNKPGNQGEMRRLVLETINLLLEEICRRQATGDRGQEKAANVHPGQIVKAVVAGNTVMTHLFLDLPANNIRLAPFVPSANHPPRLEGREAGLHIHPLGAVDCLPGVASYVGSDITAGVLSSHMDQDPALTLFMDVGTNGEIVLGSSDWLATCACSAGPAFEGAGVGCGMRATRGAIEEVWINDATFEPSFRVIGGGKPKGICGSGLIALLAEMFGTGVVDKAGHINTHLPTPRVRQGEHGAEYVIAYANESAAGREIVVTAVDIDNLVRTKGAIYAGYAVLADSVGVPMEAIERMLIGGSFGKYINVEKAIQIGLLPDLPWDRFQFLGNTSVRGAYYALLDERMRGRLSEIAGKMTYIELSADNSFYDAFMSALFLPHTDLGRFPSVNGESRA